MWNDLNMRDRHKFIKLAVTNGVYDLDTIHSLYDDTQNTYDKGGPIGRKLIKNINERSDADFVKRLQDRNRKYIVNPDNTISTHKLSWVTDNRGNAIVYPEVQNTPVGLVDYSNNTWNAFDIAVENGDTLMMSPRQADWFTRNYKKYYPEFNKYDIGGNLPTEHNRLSIDTNPIIDRIRAERLARYTAPDSALAQIKELTDNIRENEFKREFAEWINPTRNTNNYVDIRTTIPVAEARPTFINTYKDGGEKNRWGNYINSSNSEITESGNYTPEDWLRINYPDKYKQIQELHAIPAKPEQNRFEPYIVQTPKYREDIEKAAYDFGYTPYGVFLPEIEVNANASEFRPEGGYSQYYQNYKNALDDLKLRQDITRTSEEGVELTPLYQDPVFNSLFLGAGLANGISRGVLSTATKATMEGMSKPITTIASQIPQLGKYSYMLPTLDKALWAATGASGLYNRVSDEGIQGITSHPFLTAMDLGMLSPVAKGIKTVGNEAMWRYIPEIPISYIMRKNIKNTNLQKVIPQKPSGTNLMSRIKYIQELENGPSSLLIPKNKNNIIKFGDLEMNNPNLMYHVDNGNNTGFVGGITLKDNTLIPGTAKIEGQEPYIWWSKGSQYFNNNNRVITMPETKEFIRIRDSKIPIGQWNGKSGFVTNNEYVTPQIDISRGSVYTFDPDYGYVKLPTTEMPRTTNLLSQMSEYDRYKDFDFFHGGLDANFDFNTLDILRPGIKQSKKNYQYAGFYMNDLDHLAGSFRYGQGTAHGIKLKDNYKLIDLGEYNIEKMKTDELKKYIEQGYDILKGNNIWSQPEYILLNKNAILNTKFFDTPTIDYMEIPHRNPFLKQKRIKEIQNLTNNE